MDTPSGFTVRPALGGFHNLIGPFYLAGELSDRRYGFRVDERHTNPPGNIHGGLLMALMDMVLTTTIYETLDRRIPVSTVSLNCDFLAGVKPGDWVEGKGRITRQTASLAFLRGELSVNGEAVMAASGVWRVFTKAAG